MMAPEELADMNGAAEASLPGRCDVTRKTRTRQPNGSWRDTPQVEHPNVACRKVPSGQTPQELAIMNGTQGARAIAIFLLPGNIMIYQDDVIHYGGRDYGVAGVQYRTDGHYIRAIVYDDQRTPAAP